MSVILFMVTVTFIFYFIQANYKVYLTGRKICGPRAFPLLGNIQMVSKLKPEYLFLSVNENREKFRKTFRLWLGPKLWVFLHSPKETRDALNDPSLKRADTFQQLNVLIGNGLLLSEGKHWEQHRRALGLAFHPDILNSFAPVIGKHADVLVQKLSLDLEQPIEVTTYLFPCVLDTIISTSMGKELSSQLDRNGTYEHAFHSASELLFKRMVNPILASNFIFKHTKMYQKLQGALEVIHNLMDSVIEERKSYLKQNLNENSKPNKRHQTLLDILLTTQIDGRALSLQEIRDEVNTFVFAGVDTTTAALSFVLYSLAKYPEEQRRIFAEIQNLNSVEELSVNEINSLEYLDLFLKECLRFYTIVPMTGRETTKPTKIGDIEYCAGVTLWINMYGLAHDDQLFADADQFRPLRFSTKHFADQVIENFSYLPFSGGPHVCIGRKYASLIMKMLTVKIVQNFELLLYSPKENLVLMSQMVLKSLNGIHLKLKMRT